MASASHIQVVIALNDDYVKTSDRLTRSNNPALEIVDIIENIVAGIERGKVMYRVDYTQTPAAQTVTFDSSYGEDGDTVVVAGVTLTAKTTPSPRPENGEYLLYADSDTAQAVAFIAAVKRHPKLEHLVTATNASAVATITFIEGGTIGNTATLVGHTNFATVGGATFASGAAGTTALSVTIDNQACSIA
jgi:hypothetical protein